MVRLRALGRLKLILCWRFQALCTWISGAIYHFNSDHSVYLSVPMSVSATDSYAPTELSTGRTGGGGFVSRTPSTRRTDAMTSSADRSNTLPRTGSHVPTSPLPVHRQSSASNTPPSVSPRQSPTWRRKAFTAEREVMTQLVHSGRLLLRTRLKRRRFNPLTPTWVQLWSILCQTGLSRHL